MHIAENSTKLTIDKIRFYYIIVYNTLIQYLTNLFRLGIQWGSCNPPLNKVVTIICIIVLGHERSEFSWSIGIYKYPKNSYTGVWKGDSPSRFKEGAQDSAININEAESVEGNLGFPSEQENLHHCFRS